MSSKRKEDAAVARAAAKNRTKRSEQTRPEAERDSGFSDASSEHLSVLDQVEADDSSRSGGGASRTTSSQLAVVGGFSPNLSPMIIMNNVLLKQPGDAAPAALKPWGFSPGGVEVVQPPQVPQVVFLQPVVSARSTTPHARTGSEPSSKRKRHRKYLPILKAYPKIAPHPGDSSPHTSSSSSSCSSSSFSSSSSSSSSSSCSSVSVASSMKSSCSLTSVHQGRYSRDMLGGSGGGSISGSSTPCSSMPSSPLPHAFTERSPTSLFSRSLSLPATTAGQKSTDSRTQESSTADSLSTTNNNSSNSSSSSSPAQDSSSNSSTGNHSKRSLALATLTDTISVAGGNCRDNSIALAESDALATGDDDDEAGSNKRKRFCNTYNILSKSGLLDITLRTKELIRQNRRTQGDLEKLRSHTALFMEVLRSGDSAGLLRLQTCMEEDQGGDKRMA